MEKHLLQRLSNQMSRGDVILFTGAGFSLSAKGAIGHPIPTVGMLRELIWPLAFPNQPLDPDSTLGEIYEVASKRAGNRLGQLLKDYLKVDFQNLPDVYETWFSMPWYRIYTLNLDDLDAAVQAAFSLSRRIKSISALADVLPHTDGDLLSIHINGRAADYPNVTFSPRQYGERATRHESWYVHLVADLASHPILFVGTTLDEPLLWQYIELRRSRERGTRELRPGSYLVTQRISAAKRAMLQDFNIQLVEMGQEEFAKNILEGMKVEKQQGFHALSTRQSIDIRRNGIQRVSDLRTVQPDNTGEFLLGREPQWSDLVSGLAVRREFEESLKELIDRNLSRITLITGTAGSGKSTTLMRQALRLQAEGKDVIWLNLDAEYTINEYRHIVRQSGAGILAIDDVDHFGSSTANFLVELVSDNPKLTILATMRNTRLDRYNIEDQLTGLNPLIFSVPHLEDSDINLLIEALTKANRLGQLKGLSPQQQVSIFREQAGRQLLVAMIQATSNERFEEKIDRECADLSSEMGLIYAIVALATNLRHYLTKDEILLAVGDSTNETLNRIQRLLDQRLLIEFNGYQIRLRHRVVADRAVDYYHRQGLLRDPICGLLWTFATKTNPESPKRSREMQLLTKMMNHALMIKLTSDQDTPRVAYAEVEGLLNWNYHYYLQRGSYEVEIGDLDLAKNFLEQARAMAPDDYMVQTEWAYMTIKRSAQDASAVGALEQVDEAFVELEEAIERRGKADYYPYHVYGSQGLSWIRRAILSRDKKAQILSRLLYVLKEGVKFHPTQSELRQLAEDLEREYLMTAVTSTTQ